MRIRVVLTMILMTILVSLNAIPVRNVDLAALVNSSELVFSGRIAAINVSSDKKSTVGVSQLAATVLVDHVIKGTSQPGSVVVIFSPADSADDLPDVNVGAYSLFFLKRANDHYEFSDRLHPSLPAVQSQQIPSGSGLGQVVSLLGEVIVSQPAPDSDKAAALDAIARLHTELAGHVLREVLENTSGDLRLDVARILVARNDIAGFSVVEGALLRPQGLSEKMIVNLAGSLRGMKDPRTVRGLTTLADLPDLIVRRNAAAALRQTCSPAAIPALAKLLNDSDFNTRYEAVAGLGEITHQFEWTPALTEFRDHEERYVAYWQKWAESRPQ